MLDNINPFGFQFLHEVEELSDLKDDRVPTHYDPDRGMTLAELSDGTVIPLVEYFGAETTETVTRIEKESSGDEDFQPSPPHLSTETATGVERESGDEDFDPFSSSLSIGLLRTSTETKADGENSDED